MMMRTTSRLSKRYKARESGQAAVFLVLAMGIFLVGGIGFLTVADAAWAHAVGVASLFAFIVLGFYATVSSELARNRTEDRGPGSPIA